MTSFKKLQAAAAERGDGLHPKLMEPFENTMVAPDDNLTRRADGMIQSGPDPRAEIQSRGTANVSELLQRAKRTTGTDAT